ncbi:MAG: peptidylprolyl isomerase [Proteobacteria bacterium]|nr:peptidylprolyl isomerase [Pseudomonadota bacterium]
MAEVKDGDKVKVHYTGTLEDGETFDSSEGSEAFEFTLGQNMVIPGFEKAVLGMQVGNETTVTLSPDNAYGNAMPEMVTTVKREQLPAELSPEIGMMLQANAPDGSVMQVQIKEVNDDSITVDANHPLAGKTLTFQIRLVEIA